MGPSWKSGWLVYGRLESPILNDKSQKVSCKKKAQNNDSNWALLLGCSVKTANFTYLKKNR